MFLVLTRLNARYRIHGKLDEVIRTAQLVISKWRSGKTGNYRKGSQKCGLFAFWRIPFIHSGLNFNAATQIQEIHMLRFLMCLFGLHGATEIDYTVDDEEIKVCRDCLKEVE